jgi:hypothetical protein
VADNPTHAAACALVTALVFAVAAPVLEAQNVSRHPILRDISRELACGPEAVVLPPLPSIRVIASQEPGKRLFGTGETVIISAGSAHGVQVGQEYFVKRVVKDQFAMPLAGFIPVSISTAARLRIVEVETDLAFGTIFEPCDGVLDGDYLVPYVRPVVPVMEPGGEPDYANAGVIVLGNERRQIGAAGSLMVLDRGTDHGVRPGQRATVFRATLAGAGPVVRVGEATAVIVRQTTSVVRIESSRDAVYVGDRVALHK